MIEPRFKTIAEINEHIEIRGPMYPAEYDIIDEWIKETKEYIQQQNEIKNDQSSSAEKDG